VLPDNVMHWFEVEEKVRFNEVDEWSMVWYGNYMAWFEIGRMALLKKFDLLPRQMVELGYVAPVVNLNCDYKQSARTGDTVVIRTTVLKPEIAALIFKFEILHKDSRELLAKGETTQVLLTTDQKMIYRLSGKLEKRIAVLLNYCAQSKPYET
jgi:acyl-CoA thioester hydrolase